MNITVRVDVVERVLTSLVYVGDVDTFPRNWMWWSNEQRYEWAKENLNLSDSELIEYLESDPKDKPGKAEVIWVEP